MTGVTAQRASVISELGGIADDFVARAQMQEICRDRVSARGSVRRRVDGVPRRRYVLR
jgi:hypothetical protein